MVRRKIRSVTLWVARDRAAALVWLFEREPYWDGRSGVYEGASLLSIRKPYSVQLGIFLPTEVKKKIRLSIGIVGSDVKPPPKGKGLTLWSWWHNSDWEVSGREWAFLYSRKPKKFGSYRAIDSICHDWAEKLGLGIPEPQRILITCKTCK